jgi:hypothetical protein
MTSERFQMTQLRVQSVSLQCIPCSQFAYTYCRSHSYCSRDIHIYRWWDKQKKIWERAAEPISFQIRSPLQQLQACSVNYVRDNNGALNYNQKSLPSLCFRDGQKNGKWMSLPIPIFAFIRTFLCQLQPFIHNWWGVELEQKESETSFHLWRKCREACWRFIVMTERGLELSMLAPYDACMPAAAAFGGRISVWGA